MSKYIKIVNGVQIELTPAEIADIERAEAECEQQQENGDISADEALDIILGRAK